MTTKKNTSPKIIKKKIVMTKKKIKNVSLNSKEVSSYDKDIQHKYTKYYPSILDPNFSHKISTHGLFKKYKLTVNRKRLEDLYNAYETNIPPLEDTRKQQSSIYILKTISKMLRNFMSPYSPYRSLMIYHEMGVGKTCTAITIAESLKNIVKNSNTKIYIIRPNEFARQIFDKNTIYDGRPLNQCTGDTYIQNPKNKELVRQCMGKNEDACDQLKSKVDKEIRTYYKFAGSKMWAGEVLREIESKTKNLDSPAQKELKMIEVIQKMFNNAVIIVDEAHELRDTNEKESKIVPPVLNKVLQHATNVRLIFLSATPIYDKPQNIISLINYFLLNDKRQPIKEAQIFDKDGNIKSGSEKILIEKTRGYISFLRGNNPYEFPIRLTARYNISKDILDLNKYPSKNILDIKLDKDDCIKYLELVDCGLHGKQLEMMNYHVKYDNIKEIDEESLDKISISDWSYDNTEDYDPELDDELSIESILTPHEQQPPSRKRSRKSEQLTEKTVAYLFERQLGNIIFQSLDECNKNLKLAVGDLGLDQIVTKQSGKWTYEFNDNKYAKRFKLPELYNWSSKIAKIVEMSIKSEGPVFIYTNFVSAGAKPIAMALEMNGFKRYKQHDTPLVESSEKESTYRGDYILYTGDPSLSMYAQDFLNKGRKMKDEKVKVFIGTSVASEGLNLFGFREVHILDPWHNINLTEQSIGRVIRTGSHLHLPPQERNVTVYQYASTLGDRESFDLKIYKICENKAIKAGIVEKILKENALDCELNKDVNIYDTEHYSRKIPQITSHGKKIMVSLADMEYSRSCFYMKDCNFQCYGNKSTIPSKLTGTQLEQFPIMKFNIDKEIEEYKNLIIQLLSTSFNVNINNLRDYLKKIIYGETEPKNKKKTRKHNTTTDSEEWIDETAFMGAIQEILNTDIPVVDKYKREGKIVLSGNILRFVPTGNQMPNISLEKQYLPPPQNPPIKSQIDLKGFITKINDEQKRLVEEQDINYIDVLNKLIEKGEQIYYGVYQKEYKYNGKAKLEEILEILFNKLTYSFKISILKNILKKVIHGNKLEEHEKKIEPLLKRHIVHMHEIFHNIKPEADIKKSFYGFIIQNDTRLELYILNSTGDFEKNQGNLKKIVEYRKNLMKKVPNNKLYGHLKYEKGIDIPIFKITDILTKGEKKSVRGITCITKSTTDIKKNINKLDDRILKGKSVSVNKNALCNDIELLLKRYDTQHTDGKKWYYTPEEYEIYFGDL